MKATEVAFVNVFWTYKQSTGLSCLWRYTSVILSPNSTDIEKLPEKFNEFFGPAGGYLICDG